MNSFSPLNLRSFFSLIKILEQEGLTQADQRSIYVWVKDLCQHRLTTMHGETLVHLCVDHDKNGVLTFRPTDTSPHILYGS